jgi:Protein of unknown function (DUF1566)
VALVFLAMVVSSAQAIHIDEATIQNGQVFIAGDQAQRRAAISWEGVALGISTNNGGAFNFNTTDLPEDCVGRLKIGTEERDVVINNCTPADITVIEAGVPKTGQTTSFAAGDDGALEKGVASPNPRFTVNVNTANDVGGTGGIAGNGICDGTEICNGTVTDNLTGLIWLQNANCVGAPQWATAISDANSLAAGACGLSDGSVAGDWRLPNVRELQSLVDYGVLTNLVLPSGHPFTNFQASNYWSSTTFAFDSGFAWFVDFSNGFVFNVGKGNGSFLFVTAVRGGS